MNGSRSEPVRDRSGSSFSVLPHVEGLRSATVALPVNSRLPSATKAGMTDLPGFPTFGPSHSHKVWRMMNALIDAVPDWAEAEAFEQARIKILQYGLSIGMNVEELFRISDPDVILGLWTAAEAAEDQE